VSSSQLARFLFSLSSIAPMLPLFDSSRAAAFLSTPPPLASFNSAQAFCFRQIPGYCIPSHSLSSGFLQQCPGFLFSTAPGLLHFFPLPLLWPPSTVPKLPVFDSSRAATFSPTLYLPLPSLSPFRPGGYVSPPLRVCFSLISPVSGLLIGRFYRPRILRPALVCYRP
jgi:hypothetical protein